MVLLTILVTLLGIFLSLCFLAWQFKTTFRAFGEVLHINLAGDGPTKRLFPNLAFFALFLLLINLTWF